MRLPWTKAATPYAEFDAEWKTGDRDKARQIASAYVLEKGDYFAKWADLSVEQLVTMVDEAREQNQEDRRIELDMYLLHRFAPQHITGKLNQGA